MNIVLDVCAVLLVLANVLLGFRYGLLRRGFALLGLFFGVFVAGFAGNAVARSLFGSGTPDGLWADAGTFIGVAAVVTLAAEILGALYSDRIRAVASLIFDRSAGAAVGVVVGLLEISIVCVVLLSAGTAREPSPGSAFLPGDRSQVADSVRSSFIGGRVNQVESGILNVFKPVLPSDLPGHLAESAKVSSGKQ